MISQSISELTPELLAKMDPSPFTAEYPPGMDDKEQVIITEQQKDCYQHPANAICRAEVM